MSKKSVLSVRYPYITKNNTVVVPMVFAASNLSNNVGPIKALYKEIASVIEITMIRKLNIFIAHKLFYLFIHHAAFKS